MKIILYPDSPLSQVAKPVTKFGPRLAKIAEQMLDAMYEHEGVGLAAPQVGLTQRFFVCHDMESEPMCLVNPEILDMDDDRAVGEEGCLSVPQIYAPVERSTCIRVKAYDVFGKELHFEAMDFLARIIQHENDHLDGHIFLDRTDILTRQDRLAEWEAVRSDLTTGARLTT